ncbi:MAG TPA: type II secretion system protein [Phycisphaerales bacterium]|nr:type II secretion system protein [Phycisphaerales bacterium]
MRSPARKGFTLIELLVVIAIIVLLVGILLPTLGKARKTAMQVKCSTHQRAIIGSLINYAAESREQLPSPESLDPANATEAAATGGKSKNRTGAILSYLIFNYSLAPELCVTPAEVYTIQPMGDYQFNRPASALDPANAVWDPRFKGSPYDNNGSTILNMEPVKIGHNSYAHMAFAGARRQFWTKLSRMTTQPVFCNRGPQYTETETPTISPTGGPPTWTLAGSPYGTDAPSLLIHGPGNKWWGNVAFADNHVDFFKEPDPEQVTFLDKRANPNAAIAQKDNLFVDETNEGTATETEGNRKNAYMRQWMKGCPLDTFTADLHLKPGSGFAWSDGYEQ